MCVEHTSGHVYVALCRCTLSHHLYSMHDIVHFLHDFVILQWEYNYINSIEQTIQFTIETEVEGTLPFLNTWVTHHADGSLSKLVFRKKTHMDSYPDFNSHHPLAHKELHVCA